MIPCNGYINTWELWTERTGKLRAVIVRPVPGSSTEFTIVGFNDITITSAMINQKITYTVPSDEHITTENGDMIAVGTFDSQNNAGLHANSGGGLYQNCVFLDPTTLNPGATLTTNLITEATASISVIVVEEVLPGKLVNIIQYLFKDNLYRPNIILPKS